MRNDRYLCPNCGMHFVSNNSISGFCGFCAPGTVSAKERRKRRMMRWQIVETGETFNTSRELAEHIGICPTAVQKAYKHNGTARGYHIHRFYDETGTMQPYNGKVWKCKETGDTFRTAGEAAEWVGYVRDERNPGRDVWKAANSGKTFGGYHWERVSA